MTPALLIEEAQDRASRLLAVELCLSLDGDVSALLAGLDQENLLELMPPAVADREARIHAAWCARQVRHLWPAEHREVLSSALIVAWRYARGRATTEELRAADAAAWTAAYSARAAAAYAARAAAAAAARAAAAAHAAACCCSCSGCALLMLLLLVRGLLVLLVLLVLLPSTTNARA